ncbi:hypothetical protein ColTof4_02712 [Colletotrichum tofieldiae]|nr:hypothetical protein ColTof3_08993 [Colletotrichum tofieldiae]GKT70289.1 hypothetical protein ColTof4_02712 [Colletotrichum tofieldiae]
MNASRTRMASTGTKSPTSDASRPRDTGLESAGVVRPGGSAPWTTSDQLCRGSMVLCQAGQVVLNGNSPPPSSPFLY